jgi:hypothetical protein
VGGAGVQALLITAVNQRDLELSNGRRLHIYDTGADVAGASLAIFWHHGTPNLR